MVAVCFQKPDHLLENAAGIPRTDLRVPERGKGETLLSPFHLSWQEREEKASLSVVTPLWGGRAWVYLAWPQVEGKRYSF